MMKSRKSKKDLRIYLLSAWDLIEKKFETSIVSARSPVEAADFYVEGLLEGKSVLTVEGFSKNDAITVIEHPIPTKPGMMFTGFGYTGPVVLPDIPRWRQYLKENNVELSPE